jgi:aspartyl-tRNA(Asn)/glutamyl-tRNA(Gln) amidotransferase subunit A
MPVDPEIADAVNRVAEHFARAGADVQRIEPFITEQMLEDLDLFWRVRSWSTFAQLPAARKQKVLPFIADWCSAGADIAGSRVLECIDTIQEMRRATVAATTPFDIVLSPVATRAAFPAEWPMPFGEANGGMTHIGFTLPYNMSEQPAATVNCGFTEDGRTIGVQIAGRRFDDLGVLRAAAWYEQTREQSAVPAFPIRGA